MNDENKKTKIDISSTAVEKGIDIAKDFAGKLVLPPIEELGLLVKDQISYWRFSNQVKILNKAKSICENNNVSVKSIPPKLLCPYLENASLEDDDNLQDKWATLLVNMVDSKQNIQNHVFPYILSQLSKDEFGLLESVLTEKKNRVSELQVELSNFLENEEGIESDLKNKLEELMKKMEEISPGNKLAFTPEARELRLKIHSIHREISSLKFRESMLRRQIAAPQSIPENNIQEFEIANIIRLGLAKVIYKASADTHSTELPENDNDPYSYNSVDFEIDIDTEASTILTELGELFIDACLDKYA